MGHITGLSGDLGAQARSCASEPIVQSLPRLSDGQVMGFGKIKFHLAPIPTKPAQRRDLKVLKIISKMFDKVWPTGEYMCPRHEDPPILNRTIKPCEC